MNGFPVIETEQLLLRNFTISDTDAIYEIFSNDAVTEFYDLDTFTHKDQAETFINVRIHLNEQSDTKALRWAICLKSKPNIVIGSCGFHSANKSFFSIDIGYELHQQYWGKNLAYEAVKGILDYCFKNNFPFAINRVTATTDLDSKRSINLLYKLGFKEEGILRKYGYWKNKFHDVRLFSILQNE